MGAGSRLSVVGTPLPAPGSHALQRAVQAHELPRRQHLRPRLRVEPRACDDRVALFGVQVRDGANDEDGDIEITFTGLRPGEKLYEELLIGSNVSATDHPRIMRAMEKHLPLARMEVVLATLVEQAK